MDNNFPQVPNEKFYKKYLIFIIPVVGITLILAGYFLGNVSNQENQTVKNELSEVAETTQNTESEKPKYKFSTPKMSPNNDLTLQLRSDEKGGGYSLSLLIDRFPEPHSPIVYLEGVKIENGVLMNFTGDRDHLERIFGYFSNYVSWSPKENSFALLLPSKVVVYNYLTEPVENDTYSPPRSKVTLTKTHEYAIDESFDRFDYPVLLFSGNGKELYYSSKSGIKMLIPEEKMIDTQDGYYPSSIYPIPNSSGIAYWVTGNNEPDYNNHYFVTDFGTSSRKYTLTSDFSIDYPGEIILSPNLKKVCIGWGSSGGGGRVLFDLTTGKQIKSGTGCMRWINNNQIVIYSSDSPGGWESGNLVYYLVDLSTGNRTLLHNYYTGK